MDQIDLFNIDQETFKRNLIDNNYCYFTNFDTNIINDLHYNSKQFFNNSDEYKQRFESTRNGPLSEKYPNLGYFSHFQETVAHSFQSQNKDLYSTINTKCTANEEFEQCPGDLKESFNCNPIMQTECYPSKQFQYSMLNCYHYLQSLSFNILHTLERILNINPNQLVSKHLNYNSVLRIVHYNNYSEYSKDAYRIAKHRDGTTFTLIFHYDEYNDLERYNNNKWETIYSKPDSVIFHTGWKLQQLTDGLFPAMIHRVNNSNIETSRYSILFFFAGDV